MNTISPSTAKKNIFRMNPSEYLNWRDNRQKLVHEIVSAAIELKFLRGSWAKGDFHLDRVSGLSFSDLDLVSIETGENLRSLIKQKISENLSKIGLYLNVSVHKDEAISYMSLEDARILAIGEYFAKIRLSDSNIQYIGYWRAKTILLLLRLNLNERYKEVAERINSIDALSALAVKLGIESSFTIDHAVNLLQLLRKDSVTREFLHCLLSPKIEQSYCIDIAVRLRQCQSISRWLQDYLISKMRIEI